MAALSGWESSQYAAAAGTRFYAATVGSTAPVPAAVVCVHGLGVSHRYFLPVARELACQARVVAPDLPGFGRTRGPLHSLDVRGQSQALADWLRATGHDRPLLLANSTGCQVVVDLATHSPQLLGPVVLVGPTFDRHARSAPQQWTRLLANQRWEDPKMAPVLMHDWLACGPRRYAETFAFMLHDPVERKLHHVRVPTLVSAAAETPSCPAPGHTRSRKGCPSVAWSRSPARVIR